MSLKQRLTRLERQLVIDRPCAVCGGYRAPEIMEVYEGEKDPLMPSPCPGCGLKPRVILIRLFCKRSEAD